MPVPDSAARHYRRLQRLKITTVLGVRRAWSAMRAGGAWEQQYEQQVGPQINALLLAAQAAVTAEADLYAAQMLNELDFGPHATPSVVLPKSLVGVTGDGRPVDTLLATSVGRARATAARLAQTDDTPFRPRSASLRVQVDALEDAQSFLDTVTSSVLADTNRAAELVAFGRRPWVAGWVRMINPPCCSRCAILSGRFYLFNAGFERHPNCDCYHAPAPSDPKQLQALLTINTPERYFDALTEAEQDKIFTRAGAQAIRDGADISRVVNARRGMGRAQDTGRLIRTGENGTFITTEGTTRRGRLPGQVTGVRLMPESIFEIAGDDRDEAIRLLRLHGYIT